MQIGILMLMMVHQVKSKLIEFYILYILKNYLYESQEDWAKSAYNTCKREHLHAEST